MRRLDEIVEDLGGERRVIAGALMLCFLYWAWQLFAAMPLRAFDPSDPTEHMWRGAWSAFEYEQHGWMGWFKQVISDGDARPGFNIVLSLAIMAGLPHNG